MKIGLMKNTQQPTANIEHPMAFALDVHWMLDVGCWMLDVSAFPSSTP
jgi:hypothetical protein